MVVYIYLHGIGRAKEKLPNTNPIQLGLKILETFNVLRSAVRCLGSVFQHLGFTDGLGIGVRD